MGEIKENKIKKKGKGITTKISMSIVLCGALILMVSIVVGGYCFNKSIQNNYNEVAYSIANTAGSFFAENELKEYAEIVNGYYAKEVDKETLEKTQASKRYKEVHALLTKLRENMNANDVFVFTVDEYTLSHFDQQAYDDMTWNPMKYIMDSYADESLQYQLGDEGAFLQDSVNDVNDIVKTGKRTEKLFISKGTFGYNVTALQPIKENGEVVAYVGVEIPMSSLQSDLMGYVTNVVIIACIFTILLLIASIFFFIKMFLKPISLIVKEANTFVESDASVSENLQSIKTKDEIQVLAESVLKMEVDIVEYIDNITKITAEKERIGAELNVATQIQADMLPSIFPPYPYRDEFDLYASMDPAKEVGGDFYDFFMIDDNHIALVMADVSGKGVPAALFMVIAKTLIKNRAQMGGTPAEILRDVNEQLIEGNKENLFVTVWLAIIDVRTGKGIESNAGHEHPAIRRKDGDFELIKTRHSIAVATMEGIRFRQNEFELFPGDRLFVYTDGVPEATNIHNELFGTNRMIDSLNKRKNSSLSDVIVGLTDDIQEFVGEAPQFDDVTMLCFDYHGIKTEE